MDNEEIQGVKFSQFPSETPGNADEVVGLHAGDNARFSIANIVAAVRNGLANIFVPKTDVGAAGGVASLDSTGKVPSTQLPTIPSDAADISYDNTGSGLTATDVQDAIDELAQGGGGGTTVVANPAGAATDTLTKLQVANTIYSVSGGGSGANEAQLAYVETGTTATRNYIAGEYICWNGLTYTADTNIATGTTLSASGGNKNLTECVGGGFNNLGISKTGSDVVSTTHTLANAKSIRIGNLYLASIEINLTASVSSWATFATLSDYQSAFAHYLTAFNGNNAGTMTLYINMEGKIAPVGNLSSGANIRMVVINVL